METKDVLKQIRAKNHLTQDEMTEKLAVTRQAVSRWENGDSTPNPETLKQISRDFDVSVNTLLGSPRKLICQCCGMPLDEDSLISREPDGSFQEDYCKWCYADGKFIYQNMEELLDFLVSHMSGEQFPPEQARARSLDHHQKRKRGSRVRFSTKKPRPEKPRPGLFHLSIIPRCKASEPDDALS